MNEQIFCDGIGRISIIGGIVRLDLVAYSPTETDANGQPRAILTRRVVMGVDGFLQSAEKVADIARQIGQARQPAQPRPAAPRGPAQAQRPAEAPKAPPASDAASRPQAVPPQFRRESIHPEPAPQAPPRPFP